MKNEDITLRLEALYDDMIRHASDMESALDFILNFEPVPVEESPEALLTSVRQREL